MGGNAVTYRLRLKNGPDSNFTKIARMGCAEGTSANTCLLYTSDAADDA